MKSSASEPDHSPRSHLKLADIFMKLACLRPLRKNKNSQHSGVLFELHVKL